jgi:dipeptidyl aminopeptidase/acylaminoacyl peptidase
VFVHGGPTAAARAAFSLQKQFWTSRGFAIVDVNHGGSTTYGRDYRRRLNGQWGVVDVQDSVAAVDYLVEQGRVHPDRVAIRGGSAGGFTTLAALAFTDRFRAGANYFGVADIAALAADSHKFERKYDVSLVGPPDEALYRARSPLYHLDRFSEPLVTFQGSEDKVVPPNQSRTIVEALRQRGVPVAYLEFEGEAHGFRRAENIVRAQEAELFFYGAIFGFEPDGDIEPLPIDNWPIKAR